MTVSSIYWPLIIFLPTLLLPPAASGAIDPDFFVGLPIDIELGLHLLPAFALLIEFFAFEARYSHVAAAKESRQLAAGFASFYACFVEYCALYNSGTCEWHVSSSRFPVIDLGIAISSVSIPDPFSAVGKNPDILGCNWRSSLLF